MTWLLVVLLITPEGKLDVVGYPFDKKVVCEAAATRAHAHYGEAYLAARCEYHATI